MTEHPRRIPGRIPGRESDAQTPSVDVIRTLFLKRAIDVFDEERSRVIGVLLGRWFCLGVCLGLGQPGSYGATPTSTSGTAGTLRPWRITLSRSRS